MNEYGVFRFDCITALRALNKCAQVYVGVCMSVGASVNISLSLDDGIWLHLKAVSVLVLQSVGQDPRAIYYIRLRNVHSAA